MKIEVKYNIFYLIGIYLFFIVSSYAALFPTSYLDDAVVIILAIMQIVDLFRRGGEAKKELALAYILLIAIAVRFFQSYVLMESTEFAAESFFSYFKIIILLLLSFYLKLSQCDKVKILKWFCIISIPNMLRGLYEYYITYICGIYLSGKYEAGLYRLQGFTGHPIFYSMLIMLCLCYMLYYSNSKIRFIFVAICTFLSFYTHTTLMQVIVLLLLGYYVIHRTKIDSIARKYSKLIVACLMLGIVFGVFWYMSGETYTIRFVSAMATISKMNFHNFLIGDGFGTYAQAGLSESYIFHVMYETGILGIACLFIVLFVLMKEQLKEKNYIAVFVLCFYVISSLINEGYMIPFIICIPVLCCLSMQSSIEDGGFVKESV